MIPSLELSQVSSATISRNTPLPSHASASSTTATTKCAIDDITSIKYFKSKTKTITKNSIQSPNDANSNYFKKIKEWLIINPSKANSNDDSSINAKYNYQHFKASNIVFFFGGRLKTTDYHNLKFKGIQFPISIIMMLIPFIVYLIFQATWLWNNISPAIVICFIYIFLLMFTNHLKAAFLDPGILPRNIHLVDNIEQNGLPNSYHNIMELPGPINQKTGEAENVYLKYCTSCYIWRPVRSSHCSRCNVCVANLDHHCPWLGGCVGQRNYWYFLNFLIFENLTCIFLCSTSFYHLAKLGSNYNTNTKISLFLGIYSSICLLYPSLLLFYHFCLGLTGITTREYINAERHEGNLYLEDVCLDPFNSKNYSFNLKRQWFRPKGRSNFSMLDEYQLGDKRFKAVQIGVV